MPNVPPSADWPADTRYLRFGEFRVDLVEARLLQGGKVVELPARAFDVLVLLVRSPHRLLTRDAVFQAIWKNQIVEDANLTQTIWLLRRALGDDEKRCIRTVAKRGYVFAPEQPVEAVPEMRRIVPPPGRDAVAPAPAAPAAPVASRRYSRRFAGIVTGVALLAALGAWRWMSAPATPASIVIVDTRDASTDAPADAALDLAREWLAWKLGSLRRFEIAGEGAVPTDDVAGRRVVLLSSQQGKDDWQLGAQVFGGATTAYVDRKGTPRDIAGGADALARGIVEAITAEPDRDAPIDIGSDAAALYVVSIHAAKQGNRHAQIEALQRAVQAAPASGWLRLQLARALAALGQIREAAAMTEQNLGWVDTLPEATREILRAQWLSASQRNDEASTAWSALVERRPRSPGLRLALAQALVGDQRLRDAAQALDALDPASLPTEQHIRWLQLHSRYDLYFVSAPAAAATHRKIIELAGDTPRFALDRAKAEGDELLARLEAREAPASEADVVALDSIAARVAAAGSPIDAAGLRVSAASLRPREDAARLLARTAEMLTLTHAEGDVDNELQALAHGGLASFRSGAIARGRAMYQELETVAQAHAHKPGMRDAQKFLGQDALLAGRYDEAQQRLANARGATVQVGEALAALYTAQGRYGDADRASDAVDAGRASGATPPASGVAPAASYGVDCWRAGTRYARGKLAEASLLYGACGAQIRRRVALTGRIGVARVDFASGKSEQARTAALSILPALPDINDVPSRMQLTVSLAQILADMGERDAAQAALADALDFARANGLAPLEARARATLMQLALARDDTQGARAEYSAAMAVAPDSDWQVRSRLRLLHAALAGRSGDAATQLREAQSIATDATAHGDVLVELAALSLAAEPDDRERQLIAQTGARGIVLREFAKRH